MVFFLTVATGRVGFAGTFLGSQFSENNERVSSCKVRASGINSRLDGRPPVGNTRAFEE